MTPASIPQQVKLPFRMAVGVVSQGIRIRFGRSLITVMGVVFGIAFLMSTLSAQILRRGVAQEESARIEARRMVQTLQSESGSLTGKSVGIAIASKPTLAEQRLLTEILRSKPGRIDVAAESEFQADRVLEKSSEKVPASKLNDDAVLLIIGDIASAPQGLATGLQGIGKPLVAATRRLDGIDLRHGVRAVNLAPPQSPAEESAKQEAAAREKARGIWITVISLVVTVIGISNAMLMSVTERFREIGTMKCLGALSSFVRTIFLVESVFMGMAGGVLGVIVGMVFSFAAYSITYDIRLVLAALADGVDQVLWFMVTSLLAGVLLSVVAALYPARVASRMIPAVALRSNV